MKAACALVGLLVAETALAAGWSFGEVADVAVAERPGVFHHLESAGRKNLAVSESQIAIVWEDNRTHAPQAYVAVKGRSAPAFEQAHQVSTGWSAYEPAVAALPHERFLVAWEQDEAVWARIVSADGLGPAQRVSGPRAQQASVAAGSDGRAFLVWTEFGKKAAAEVRIAEAQVDARGYSFRVGPARRIDTAAASADQQYPSVATNAGGLVVAWEDRRAGHTVLLYAQAASIQAEFSRPQVLNEQPALMSSVYGRGTGAARVTLAARGKNGFAAAWLDKRDFTSGYDVYAAFSAERAQNFGRNEKVQDEFGNSISQWHAALATDAGGRVAVAWSDDRDGSLDVWLSWPETDGWSADLAVPGASGPGTQSSPVLAFDAQGGLHVAWVDQSAPEAPTRVRYVYGRRSAASH